MSNSSGTEALSKSHSTLHRVQVGEVCVCVQGNLTQNKDCCRTLDLSWAQGFSFFSFQKWKTEREAHREELVLRTGTYSYSWNEVRTLRKSSRAFDYQENVGQQSQAREFVNHFVQGLMLHRFMSDSSSIKPFFWWLPFFIQLRSLKMALICAQ